MTIYIGIYFFGDRKYYFISLLIILEAMLPFALIFERRKPQARELVIIAVLCAIGVAGRVAFLCCRSLNPSLQSRLSQGLPLEGNRIFSRSGHRLCQQHVFGQGPLTPWQMFAFGVIGFLAGVLFRKGLLLRSRTALCVSGTFGISDLRRFDESRRTADQPAFSNAGYALALLFAGAFP